jgi:hypothetical protein
MKQLAFVLITLSLAACSTASKVAQGPEACYTTSISRASTNGNTSGDTVVECSDKPGYWHKQAGVAKQCRPFITKVDIKGREKNVQGYMCQHPDGVWRPEFN